jgi:hypothetical protein
VDLNSYAELAVRLVNTESAGGEDGDRLTSLEGLRTLVADREHLSSGMTRNDLEALRDLRGEFRDFFAACADGDGDDAAARLNALLIQHPVHPQLSGHDGQPWHVHYTESGSVADKYAAGAAMGLAVRLTDLGLERFGVCQAAGCGGVFIEQHPAILLGSVHEPGERVRVPGPQARRGRTGRRGAAGHRLAPVSGSPEDPLERH